VRRTWALKGKTPIVVSAGGWKNLSLLAAILCTPAGRKPKLFLKSLPGAVHAKEIIAYLHDLKRHRAGRKILLFWDGLAAHRAKIVRQFLKENASWLRAVRMPAYAPELNPPEYLWAAMKAKDLANLRPEGLSLLRKAVRSSYRRIKKKPDLLAGFLKASKLF
jgi:transposase